MSKWIAHYEEGYVNEGVSVTLTDTRYHDQPWASADEALRYWRSSGLSGAGVEAFDNGLQQTADVSDQVEFLALGVTSIWRRVSFEFAEASEPQRSSTPLQGYRFNQLS